jgi:hypothetical protein
MKVNTQIKMAILQINEKGERQKNGTIQKESIK